MARAFIELYRRAIQGYRKLRERQSARPIKRRTFKPRSTNFSRRSASSTNSYKPCKATMATDRPSSAASGFAMVAQRISGWTTNGLLTAIVLLAGLGFGRHTLRWWAADASPPGNPASDLAEDASAMQAVGDDPIRRNLVVASSSLDHGRQEQGRRAASGGLS